MKYSVITFGCRVNQADSLGLEEKLSAAGGIATVPADADVVVVNTCSVTATADQGARQTIRRIARDNPASRIIVTGCAVQVDPRSFAAADPSASVVDSRLPDALLAEVARLIVWLASRDSEPLSGANLRLDPH